MLIKYVYMLRNNDRSGGDSSLESRPKKGSTA
jgi:hypothetical protein